MGEASRAGWSRTGRFSPDITRFHENQRKNEDLSLKSRRDCEKWSEEAVSEKSIFFTFIESPQAILTNGCTHRSNNTIWSSNWTSGSLKIWQKIRLQLHSTISIFQKKNEEKRPWRNKGFRMVRQTTRVTETKNMISPELPCQILKLSKPTYQQHIYKNKWGQRTHK